MPDEIASHASATPPPPGDRNGQRFTVALVCWLLSSLGVLFSLMLVIGGMLWPLLPHPPDTMRQNIPFFLSALVLYAWVALAVMTEAWVNRRRVAWHWPVLGGLAGLVCAVFFMMGAWLCLPCIGLGIYLVYAHLTG